MAWFEARPRPAQLLMVVTAVIAIFLLADSRTEWRVWNQIFFPDTSSVAKVRFWSALIYNLALALGLPVAFLVWHWRDKNARDQIEQQRLQVENSRKDTNLQEFLEVQGRAVGLFDKKMPPSACEQLQIAALHQLRGFLRGEYGDAFKRPAFELLFAGHAEAMDRIGMQEVRDRINESNFDYYDIARLGSEKKSQFDRIMRERIGIIRDEIQSIINSGFPLEGRNWDFCNLNDAQFQEGVSLRSGSFMFSRLTSATLNRVDLSDARLEGANLHSASLNQAILNQTQLKGALVIRANFTSATLRLAKLQSINARFANFTNANLRFCSLNQADLSHAVFEKAIMVQATLYESNLTEINFQNADLENMLFNEKTRFCPRYDNMTDEEVEAARQNLIDRGAIQYEGEDDDIPF